MSDSINVMKKNVQYNLDLVTLNLVTTCDLVTTVNFQFKEVFGNSKNLP